MQHRLVYELRNEEKVTTISRIYSIENNSLHGIDDSNYSQKGNK